MQGEYVKWGIYIQRQLLYILCLNFAAAALHTILQGIYVVVLTHSFYNFLHTLLSVN